MPTRRGIVLLAAAAVLYIAGRLAGTWELYFSSFALLFLVGVSWLVVAVSGRGIRADLHLSSDKPTAGERVKLHVRLQNGSFLPAPDVALRLDLRMASGEVVEWGAGMVGPRRRKALERLSAPVFRGAYDIAPLEIDVTDYLGLACHSGVHGERRSLLVLPRVPSLSTAQVFARGFPELGGGNRGLLPHGAPEFRGVRPHQPGEPLNRIDWKSTAKTRVLMLKETDEPGRAHTVVVLDGSRYAVAGERPFDSFEASVAIAGGLADVLLRTGSPVDLFLHAAREREITLEGGESERTRLLELLATARADAKNSLGETLSRGFARFASGSAAVVVSSAFDRRLLLSLAALAVRRVPILVVHVSPAAFGDWSSELEQRRFFFGLAEAGIHVLIMRATEPTAEGLEAGLASLQRSGKGADLVGRGGGR